jgi:hemolysin III
MVYADRRTSLYEEIANSITHGIGFILSIIGLVVLIVLALLHGDVWRIVGCSVFGLALVVLYGASTLYHGLRSPRAKRVLKIVDHSAIYLLIAGTYTPFTLISLRGPWGWTLFGIVWSLSLIGIILKAFFVDRFKIASVLMYVGMGWVGLIALRPMIAAVPFASVLLLLVGGLLYTSGVIFFAWEKLPYNHTIWHVFVMAGSVCHFFAVMACLGPGAA